MKNNKILQALTFLIKKPAVILIPLILLFRRLVVRSAIKKT